MAEAWTYRPELTGDRNITGNENDAMNGVGNDAARVAITRVRDRGGDRSVDEVESELMAELETVVPRLRPDAATIRSVARDIVDGTLSD